MSLTEEDLALARSLAADVLEPSGPLPALGALVDARHGGLGLSHAVYGEICRCVAEVSPSRQALLTVHSMVCRAVGRWGSESLQERYMGDLAKGTSIGAFALTESGAGSDVRRVSTSCEAVGDDWVLTGQKRWITYGLDADYFLVFAKATEGHQAMLIHRTDPGVRVQPAQPTSGLATAQLADLYLEECRVPRDRLVGRPGAAISHIAPDALTLGRLSIAFAAWGLARSALRASTRQTIERHQFDGPLYQRQLVRGMLADASVAVDATRDLCRRAARSMDDRHEWMMHDVLTAKLVASRTATSVAATAVQLHGAAGLVEGCEVDRQARDARVFEVIEGNTQIMQDLIAKQVLARYRSGDADEY